MKRRTVQQGRETRKGARLRARGGIGQALAFVEVHVSDERTGALGREAVRRGSGVVAGVEDVGRLDRGPPHPEARLRSRSRLCAHSPQFSSSGSTGAQTAGAPSPPPPPPWRQSRAPGTLARAASLVSPSGTESTSGSAAAAASS